MNHKAKESSTLWRRLVLPTLLLVLLAVLCSLVACESVTYPVAFYADGELVKTVDVPSGKTTTLPESLGGEQYGEVKDADGKAFDFTTPIEKATSLYVESKKFTVTFVAADGTQTTETVKWGSTIAERITIGYKWQADGADWVFTTPIKSDLTLNQIAVQYTVTFTPEEGETTTVTVKHGETVAAAALSDAYEGWTLGGAAYDFAKPVTGDLTLKAALKQFSVVFEAEDGETKTVSVKYGHTVPVAEVPEHHTAWTLDGAKYDFATPVTKDLKLSSELETLTLTYYDHDGTLLHTQTVKYGKTAVAYALPEYATAWHYAGKQVPYAFAEAVTEDAQIVADYEWYTVWLEPKDGARDYRLVRRGETVETVAVPAHHTAWTLNGEVYDFATPVTGEIVLVSPLEKVAVKLVTEDGDTETVYVDYGYALGTAAVSAHHTAWTLNGEVYDLATPVTEEITLVSPWELLTVTFTIVDGESKTVTVKYGYTVSAEAVAAHHVAWVLGDAEYDFTAPVTEDITLVSDWFWYTVSYVFGGQAKPELTAKYHWGETVKAPETIPYQEAWMLGDEAYDFANTAVEGDLVLTSQYRKVTVSFKTMKNNGRVNAELKTLTLRMYDTIPTSEIPSLAAYYQAFATGKGADAFDFSQPVVTDGDTLTLYAYIKQAKATIVWSDGLSKAPEDQTVAFYLDQKLEDFVLFRQFSKVSYTKGGEALTGTEVPTGDITLYVTPKTYKVTYTYADGVKLLGDYTTLYDATTVSSFVLPNAVCKDAYLTGYKMVTKNGSEVDLGDSSYFWIWSSDQLARAEESSFTDLTIRVDFAKVNRAVTAAESGLSVTAAGELSVGNAATFKAWLTAANGRFVIPRTVDGVSVKNIKIGAFANITEIKSLYIFDFDANDKLILDNKYYDTSSNGGAANRTFFNCTGLTELVVYSDTVTSLGKGSFNNTNTKLTKATVVLGAVQVEGTHWFYQCKTLTTAYVELSAGSTLTTALDGLFKGATGLQSATVICNGAKLGNSLFDGCTGLTTATLICNDTTLGNSLFNGCKKLTTVTLESNAMTVLPQSMFSGCELLETLNLKAPKLTEIGFSAFNGCKNFVPGKGFENVTTIGGSAFNGCAKLTSLDFLNLKNIKFTSSSSSAFANTGLTGVLWDVAPGSVLPSSMFQNCRSLKWFIIPENSKRNTVELWGSVFSGCESLTTVEIDFSLPDYKNFGNYGAYFFSGTGLTHADLKLNDEVTKLPDNLFDNCRSLLTVRIEGAKLANIGSRTFNNCTELLSVTVKNDGTVENFMVSSAFIGDAKLKSIDLPRPTSGKYSGSQMHFSGLDSLEYISNMDAYTDLLISCDNPTSSAWYKVSQGSSSSVVSSNAPLFAIDPETGVSTWNGEILLFVSHNVREKDENGVYVVKQAGMDHVTIPATVRYVYSGAFGVDNYTHSASVTSIDFSQATNLTGMGGYLFENAILETVSIPDSVEKIREYAFNNAKNLKSVKLPSNEKFTTIPDNMFYGTGKNLKTVEIPQYVTAFARNVFSHSWVETLTYEEGGSGANIKSVGTDMFSSSYGNVDVYGILSAWTSMKTVPTKFLYNAYGTRGVQIDGENVISVPSWYNRVGEMAFALAGRYPTTEDENIPSDLRETDISDRVTVKFESAAEGTRVLTNDRNPFGDGNDGINIVNRVILPDDAVEIGALLTQAKGLTEPVTIPAGVKKLDGTFQGCENLTKIIFAEGGQLNTIGSSTFTGCKALTAIENMPASVTSVGQNAFNDLKQAHMTVDWTLNSVGLKAFYDMYYLSGKITLTADAMKSSVGANAFAFNLAPNRLDGNFGNPNYSDLPSLTINFTSDALAGDVVLNTSVFANRNIAFAVDGKATTELNFASVKTLSGGYQFAYNPNLTAVTLNFNNSGNVTINNGMFMGCGNLQSVTLGVKNTNYYITVNGNAFGMLPKLAYFEAPANTAYNSGAFTGSFGEVKAVRFKLNAVSGVTYVKNGKSDFIASTSRYTPWYIASATGDRTVTVELGAGLTETGAYAFANCGDLTMILPEGLTTISDCSFSSSGLKSIVIPNGVTKIGSSAFSGCSNLTSVTLPTTGQTTISANAFQKCTALKSIVIPNGVIFPNLKEDNAVNIFDGCTALESVTLPADVTITLRMFANCTALKTIHYGGTQEQWNALSKGVNWNLNVPADCRVICSDSE